MEDPEKKKNCGIPAVVTILILLLTGGAFYWYEYRPAQIRKACVEKTIETSQKLLAQKHDLFQQAYDHERDASHAKYMKGAIEKGFYNQEDFEAKYRDCLRSEGLEK